MIVAVLCYSWQERDERGDGSWELGVEAEIDLEPAVQFGEWSRWEATNMDWEAD
jgi:hypothetical protein